jgi:hypothetical protein
MLNITSNVLSVLFNDAVNFKYYIAFVVDERMSIELWCTDTDTGKN